MKKLKNLKMVFDHCRGYVMEDFKRKGKFFVYEFCMSDFGYLGDMEEEEVNVLQIIEIDGKKVAVLENDYEMEFNADELYDSLEMALNEF